MTNGKVQIGIVGTGIGRWHIESYSEVEQAEIAAICDIDQARLKEAADKYGVERIFTDFKQVCDDDGIDAVSICVPNSLHHEVAVYALNAGKHILCEKPLADTIEHGRLILDAATAHPELTALVGMKFRYGGEAQHIRGLVDSGEMGQVYYGWSTYLRNLDGIPKSGWFSTKAMSGGGALIDNGVHLLDVTWFLMGCPKPVSACGMTTQDLAPVGVANREWAKQGAAFDVEDFGCGIIRFENDAAAMLDNAWASFVPQEVIHIRVLGSGGGAELYPFQVTGEDTDGGMTDLTPAASDLTEKSQFAHFVDCILKGDEPIAPVSQGFEMLQMLDGLYRSHETGASVSLIDQ